LNRNLLSFKDICLNGYYIETNNEKDMKYFYISTIELKKKCILEKLSTLSYGLYYTYISTIEMHVMVNQKFTNQNECLVWHDQLDDLYYAYISTIKMHVMVNQKFTNQNEFLVWYDHLGHLGSIMMRKKGWKTHANTHLRVKKLLQTNEFSCTICSQKLIIRPSPEKLKMSQSHF